MLDQIKNLSHRLRLFGIHAGCDRRSAEALAGQLHPLEFLRLILEDELLSRKDRVSKRLTTQARFRFGANLVNLFALLLWIASLFAYLAGMVELAAASTMPKMTPWSSLGASSLADMMNMGMLSRLITSQTV